MRIKYALVRHEYVDLPSDCEILSVHLDNDILCVAYVDNSADMYRVQVKVLEYGGSVPVGYKHVMSGVLADGRRIFVYMEGIKWS